MLLLSIALTASTIVTPASAMLDAFREFCPANISPQAALSKADAQGWHRIASAGEKERQLDGPAPMTLHASDDARAGEDWRSCGIKSDSNSRDLAALAGNVKGWLGFPPTVDLKTTVTYFLLWDGAQWRDGAHLPTAEFQKAKAAGHFYSLTAMSTEGGSSLFWLQSRPTR